MPIDPTVITGLPVTCLIQPPRFLGSPAYSGSQKRRCEAVHLVGIARQFYVIVIGLPLRDAEDDREILADRGAAGGNDFGGEGGAVGDVRTAVAIAAQVGPIPKELVKDIAMRAVELDCVASDRLGGARRFGEGGDRIGDVAIGHRAAAGNIGAGKARRADQRRVRRIGVVEVGAAADVP